MPRQKISINNAVSNNETAARLPDKGLHSNNQNLENGLADSSPKPEEANRLWRSVCKNPGSLALERGVKLSGDNILSLQRLVGNRAVQRLIATYKQKTPQPQPTASQSQKKETVANAPGLSQTTTSLQRFPLPDHVYDDEPLDTDYPGVVSSYALEILSRPDGKKNLANLVSLLENYKNGVPISEQAESFQSISGEEINGFYHNQAKQTAETSYQSRDAEVAMLQKVENYLEKNKAKISQFNVKKLYIRLSKGPCNSCRELIRQFKQRHNDIKIIITYSQKAEVTRDFLGKDRGQQALSYGFADARPNSKENFYRVYPVVPVELPERPKGYGATFLNNLFQTYTTQEGLDPTPAKIRVFVGKLSIAVVKETDRELVGKWLFDKVQYERFTTLRGEEPEILNSISNPQGGRDVRANAKLCLYQLAKPGDKINLASMLQSIEQLQLSMELNAKKQKLEQTSSQKK